MSGQLIPSVGSEDHAMGPIEARVLFVEYGDYECPHCQQAHSIIKEIRDRLGDRIRYVYRHFPIRTSHPHAQHAAESAEAAASQGKFWEMHNMLFEHQGELDDAHLILYAEELGLDVELFKQELNDGLHANRVREDFKSGVRSGVNGTPTFYINGVRYDGPWDVESLMEEIQKPLGVQVRNLFNRFTQLQASSVILLLVSTVLALFLANSNLSHQYFEFWETYLSLSLGNFELSMSLLHWVNDGLMVLFFFVVGLEIKREVTVGELSSPRRAMLPIFAALGGMLVPALIYTSFNAGSVGADGWAIPMATDIAFTLGILTVLSHRIPLGLKVFFTALAIADDLGAVLVLAIFYSDEISRTNLIIALLIMVLLVALNRGGVRNPLPYGILGIFLWLAFLGSGIHPTVSGILLALTIPARSRVRAQAFLAQCTAILSGVDRGDGDEELVDTTDRQQTAAHTLERIAERMQTPAQRMEHTLTPWATFVVLPIFALANAGVQITGDIPTIVRRPIFLGIFFGLIVGKTIGITLFSWLAVKLGFALMPERVKWPQLISATTLGGIGFTMSLFIASSAFLPGELLSVAKVSIMIASVVAGALGYTFLVFTSRERDRMTELSTAPSTST
jgi:NhaA family Na+:H+ antiporter